MGPRRRRIDVYFDFISPYAYLGWCAARRLADRRPDDVELVPHPVLFAGILGHWGQLGPAEIPPKRVFTFKDVVRRAADLGVPIAAPAAHPFNPLLALRSCTVEASGDRQLDAIDAIYHAVWVEGLDPTSEPALTAALDTAGLGGPATVGRAASPEVKEALKRETGGAIERGVFGVPTFVIDGELFFGHDRLGDVERYLDGRDPIDEELSCRMREVPIGATRRR